MGLAYLVFENLAEVFDTAAKVFLEKQEGMDVYQLDCLFIGLSIVAFAKTLIPNCELANRRHAAKHWQIIGGTNQLLSLRDKQSKDLSRSALTLILIHHTCGTALLVPPLAMRARDATGANAANTVKILSELFYIIDTQKLFGQGQSPAGKVPWAGCEKVDSMKIDHCLTKIQAWRKKNTSLCAKI